MGNLFILINTLRLRSTLLPPSEIKHFKLKINRSNIVGQFLILYLSGSNIFVAYEKQTIFLVYFSLESIIHCCFRITRNQKIFDI